MKLDISKVLFCSQMSSLLTGSFEMSFYRKDFGMLSSISGMETSNGGPVGFSIDPGTNLCPPHGHSHFRQLLSHVVALQFAMHDATRTSETDLNDPETVGG